MEVSVLHCVNPYDVNPISGSCMESRSEAKPVKLEMEEFSDLAPFLPKSISKPMTNSTDELNTPVFDRKGPFNFMVHDDTYIELPAATDPFKFEYDTFRTGNSVHLNRQQNDFSVCSNNVSAQLQDTNNCEVVNSVQGSEANLLFTTSESDQGNIIIIDNGKETPTHVLSEDHISASILKVEDTNSVISVQSNDNQFSNVSSPYDEYSFNNNNTIAQLSAMSPLKSEFSDTHLGIETPEDSSSSFAASELSPKVPKLKLDFTMTQSIDLNTPDVIDSVVDLETSFNILDYVNDKDVTTVNVEDIHFEEPSTFRGLAVEAKDLVSSKLRSRKSRKYEDDDEDYVPPPAKRRRSVRKRAESSESESEDEAPRSKRGRKQRRTSSISSDHSDASKYRELRDKNNEASRKSRLKRKMKELTLQKEADQLYERNVKLKAQVEEYERMVNNFRNNLFKIMLKK